MVAEIRLASAITAGTPISRIAATVLGIGYPTFGYPTQFYNLLKVDNPSAETLIFILNGVQVRRVGPGRTATFDKDVYGPITHYSVDASGNLAANAYEIIEEPGTPGETDVMQTAER